MKLYQYKHGNWQKIITTAVVCLFLLNDIAAAHSYQVSSQNTRATLSPESRLKPFFENHGLDFQDAATVIMAASSLKRLVINKAAREGAIHTEIERLNILLKKGNVEIASRINTAKLSSGKDYKYTVFNFNNEKKAVRILFLDDHAALIPEELAELGIQDAEKRHLDCPGLEGVWFVNDGPVQGMGTETHTITVVPAADQKKRVRLYRLINSACRVEFLKDWVFTEDERTEIVDWLLADAPDLLPSERINKKMFVHIVLYHIEGTRRPHAEEWLNILAQRWGLTKKQLKGLLKWLVGAQVSITDVSEAGLAGFIRAYVRSYQDNSALKDNFSYYLPPNITDDEKLRLAAANIDRVSRMFSPAFARKEVILRAPIAGTGYYIFMRYGLAESTHGVYLALEKDGDNVLPGGRVLFRIGLDTQGDALRVNMVQGVAGKQDQIREFSNKMGMHPGVALLYFALQIANRGNVKIDPETGDLTDVGSPFIKMMGMRPEFIPTMDNGCPSVLVMANYSKFGLSEKTEFARARNVRDLNILLESRQDPRLTVEAKKTRKEKKEGGPENVEEIRKDEMRRDWDSIFGVTTAFECLKEVSIGAVGEPEDRGRHDNVAGKMGPAPVRDWGAAKNPKNEAFTHSVSVSLRLARGRSPSRSSQTLLPSTSRAEAFAGRIHDENLKCTPAIGAKAILCHIVADPIVPAGQRGMLKVAVEQDIAKRAASGEEFRERVVFLGASATNPDEFIRDLRAKIQEETNTYRDMGYTDIQFDVACPSVGLVKVINGSEPGLKALSFEPCEGGDFNITQVEGIMLALRALHSGDIVKLKSAFVFLSGNKLSPEQSAIMDLNEFITTVTFILPRAKIEDYNACKRIYDLIAANIKQAA